MKLKCRVIKRKAFLNNEDIQILFKKKSLHQAHH